MIAPGNRRTTAATADERNRMLAALADSLLFAHAEPGSSTEHLGRVTRGWGKPLYRPDGCACAALDQLQAQPTVPGWLDGA